MHITACWLQNRDSRWVSILCSSDSYVRLKKKKAVVNFLAPCAAEIGLTHTNCALQIIFVIYFCLSMLGEI